MRASRPSPSVTTASGSHVEGNIGSGSAFARHVVLIWTVSGHTYGVGFHNVHGIRPTLDLDVALARGITLVAPVDS
jgi:hypothetical protein